MIDRRDITGLVLAGGRGGRMGGVDKGLQPFRGVPLALHGLLRLAPQVGSVMVNANRNLSVYTRFGVPVWPDATADHDGPLAGFLCGLERCETPYLMTIPCDSPLFPTDLVDRLATALQAQGAELAVPCSPALGETGGAPEPHSRPQPVFCLLRTDLLDSLARFTRSGGRKIGHWIASHRVAEVDFNDALAFANANTLQELQALEACVVETGHG